MSIFRNQGCFGALGGVLWKHRDSLVYSITVAASVISVIKNNAIDPKLAFVPATREILRAVEWFGKAYPASLARITDIDKQRNYMNYFHASAVGIFVGMGLGFVEISLGQKRPLEDIAASSGLVVAATAIAVRMQLTYLPHGLKDLKQSYITMWNYIDHDGEGGGHKQRFFNSVTREWKKIWAWKKNGSFQHWRQPAYAPRPKPKPIKLARQTL